MCPQTLFLFHVALATQSLALLVVAVKLVSLVPRPQLRLWTTRLRVRMPRLLAA